jgi:hypothetical protein
MCTPRNLLLVLVLVAVIAMPAVAEMDFLDITPEPNWYIQNYQLFYKASGWAGHDPECMQDADISSYMTLFELAYWDDSTKYYAHIIIPFGCTSYEHDIFCGPPTSRNHICGLGDIYTGPGRRWIWNDEKTGKPDLYFLAGVDFRIPTGNYDSSLDPYRVGIFNGYRGLSWASGSFAVEPYVKMTKLFFDGLFASDTELRYDVNTTIGPIQYNPNDRLEFWQNVSVALGNELRVGGVLKGEFDINEDQGKPDHRAYMGFGPGVFYKHKNISITGKVLFEAMAQDVPNDSVLLYLRLSVPF